MSIAKRTTRAVLTVLVCVAGVVTIVASSGWGGPAQPPATPTKGSVSVSVGSGPVTSTPYQCTGSTTVTLTAQSLTGTDGATSATPQTLIFDMLSSTTPNEPACQKNAFFGDLRPGTWTASAGITSCPVTVTAGQSRTVKVWNGVCQ